MFASKANFTATLKAMAPQFGAAVTIFALLAACSHEPAKTDEVAADTSEQTASAPADPIGAPDSSLSGSTTALADPLPEAEPIKESLPKPVRAKKRSHKASKKKKKHAIAARGHTKHKGGTHTRTQPPVKKQEVPAAAALVEPVQSSSLPAVEAPVAPPLALQPALTEVQPLELNSSGGTSKVWAIWIGIMALLGGVVLFRLRSRRVARTMY